MHGLSLRKSWRVGEGEDVWEGTCAPRQRAKQREEDPWRCESLAAGLGCPAVLLYLPLT